MNTSRPLSTIFVHALGGTMIFAAASAAVAAAPDWPRFRGPNGDGICTETGLLQTWPEGGPKLLWKLEGIGNGFSSFSIVGNRMYTMGDRKVGDALGQCVIAIDLPSQKIVWFKRIGPPHKDGHGGPRGTPTIDDGFAYAVGTEGDVACLDTKTGDIRWRKNFVTDFGGEMMSKWKFSESPLIDGDKLVCTPGGKTALMVALAKKSGSTIWKCAPSNLGSSGKDGAGYSSIVAADIDGVRQYITNVGHGAIGVDAQTGKLLWNYSRIANDVANIPTPIVRGDEVFATNSYGAGSALFHVVKSGRNFTAKEVWFDPGKQFENHHGGVVLVDGYLYGGSGLNKGVPTCLNWKTGKIAWQGKAPGKNSCNVLYADNRLVFVYEGGTIALAEASPEAFTVVGRFECPSKTGPIWTHPVIHEGRMYLRDNNTLYCYDVQRP